MATNSFRFLDLPDAKIPMGLCNILDKPARAREYIAYMLDRTNNMFEWKGLPDTIPQYILETYLPIYGYAAFIRVDKQRPIPFPVQLDFEPGVYVFFGGIGGERDIYYRPRTFIAANPRLDGSINATIIYDKMDGEYPNPCVLMRNDTNYNGLLPLFQRYAAQMVENDISIRSAQINARAQVGIATSTDRDAEAARKYLDALEAGKLATLADKTFLEGVTVANVGVQSANIIIQLIELQQYLKASWFNELGLNANFNMKREYISREEIGSQTDVLLPLVDDMLDSRRRACELLKEVFGLDVTVEKNSAWSSKDQTVLNSLATGAEEAGIGLQSGVADMLDGGNNVQLPGNSEGVDSRAGEGEGERDGGGEGGESGLSSQTETEAGVPTPAASPVQVEVNINVDTEGGDVDVQSVSEESEESDDKKGV